jgi:hypothetical protein
MGDEWCQDLTVVYHSPCPDGNTAAAIIFNALPQY